MRANTTAHAVLDKHAEAFVAELRKAEFIDRGQGQYLDPSDVKAAFLGPIQDAMQKERLRPLTAMIRLEVEKLLDEMSQMGLITREVRAHIDMDDLVDHVRKVLTPRLASRFKGGTSGE